LIAQAQLDGGSNSEIKSLRQQLSERAHSELNVSGGLALGPDEKTLRAAQKEAQRQYYAQITADNWSDHVHEDGTKEFDSEYIQQTGWTGLQVGGLSSDGTKSMVHLHAVQKHAKQSSYRKALREQQVLDAEIARDRKYRDIESFPSKTVPYMR
jgi:hypothetical protein